jgi:hypothetical protein
MPVINNNTEISSLLEKLSDIRDTVSRPKKAQTKQAVREIVAQLKQAEFKELQVLVNPELEPEYFNQFIDAVLNPTPRRKK